MGAELRPRVRVRGRGGTEFELHKMVDTEHGWTRVAQHFEPAWYDDVVTGSKVSKAARKWAYAHIFTPLELLAMEAPDWK